MGKSLTSPALGLICKRREKSPPSGGADSVYPLLATGSYSVVAVLLHLRIQASCGFGHSAAVRAPPKRLPDLGPEVTGRTERQKE